MWLIWQFWKRDEAPGAAFVVAIGVICILALMLLVTVAYGAPPAGSNPQSPIGEWYRSLVTPKDGWGCCSIADCRPVKWRTRDGHYEAFINEATYPDSGAPNAWVTVPDEVVIHRHDNPIGEAVACWYNATIRCFVPGVET